MPVDDPDLPQFSSADACEAAGLDAATLKNWASRKQRAVHLGDEERVQIGHKTEFRLTLRRVLQLAVTVELVRIGLSPREAALHAFGFTDIEHPRTQGSRGLHLLPEKRGVLCRKHYTLLIVYSRAYAEVVNVKADDVWRLVLRKAAGAPSHVAAAAIVNLNDVDLRVRTALGLPLTAREGVI
jgi:hypothetical protein